MTQKQPGLTPGEVERLVRKYGGKTWAYRSAVRAGLTSYVVAKAFGVTKWNVWNKCYGKKSQEGREENHVKFARAHPMDDDDVASVYRASGVRMGPLSQRRRKADPSILERVLEQLEDRGLEEEEKS